MITKDIINKNDNYLSFVKYGEIEKITPKLFSGYEVKQGYNLAGSEKEILDTVYLRKRVPFADELDFDAIDRDNLKQMADAFLAVVRKRIDRIVKGEE